MSKPKTPKDGATGKLDLRVAGKRIRPTTGISDPKVAHKVASASKELAEHVGTASPERLKRLCAAIFDAAGVTPWWENQTPEPTPSEFVTNWLCEHRASLSDDLYAKYCGALQNFVEMCPASTVRLIRRSHVLSWHRDLEKQFSPATASQKVGLLAKALQDAVDEGLMDSNPARRIGSVTATVERRDLSDTQINQVRHWLTHSKEAHKQEWIVAIDLARWNGLRLMDAVSIRPENVDVGNYILDFVCQKTGQRMVVPMHPAVDSIISMYGFCDHLRLKSKSQLSQCFTRFLERAGVENPVTVSPSGRELREKGFHSLRHSFISWLDRSGVSEETRMKLAGHKSRKIHAGYSHVDLIEQARKIAPW
jgi:integrase